MTPKERFRRAFVLVLTIAYAIAFFAMLSGFFEALLLAAVFTGIIHPVYHWLQGVLGGRTTLASLLTLAVALLAILLPLLFVLGPMVAALFLTVLAIYSEVFGDWLNVDTQLEQPPAP